jgi:hypothetical protein
VPVVRAEDAEANRRKELNVKLEIYEQRGRWVVRAEGGFDNRTVTHVSDHKTACDAARAAAGVLRSWSTTEGRCKPYEELWLVFGESEKLRDFARIASGGTRLEAARAVAKVLGDSCATSRDCHDNLRVVIDEHNDGVLAVDGWETPHWFWMVGVTPLELGVNLADDEAWDWSEEEVEGC